ncbi:MULTISPECIES: LpqB family beta-propeller domain-containing protein [Streptomyces]|uniref:Acyl-peptide hydrolase n=1 Tax=Streptomyces fradiae ATCC 10745 = DSM 40063 TaxID=1319510 RepID=A0A1Y2NMA5_STRFR|nr:MULTISPECIES: prolyl oligopeptidase family serine peptidase [Streptomyces]KAF0646465.1 acyl-peptide hydrolase [Streptomyces fradiae ATCC 10745 = DSM 40063]OSY48540.1 Prolyl oligopeptidase family protein [Streptomyces fradiae ATCC 10745 = DSM 40063]QEV14911.1 S9 family peptidase [Streptomyces fradiae ATCC 10745 = DSM 40063]UQS29745.1 S9 family peptidase [Streptomyces fradiae]
MEPTRPYGTWPSPIDAGLAAAHDGLPEYVGTVGDEVWWTAPRPAEGGRRALVRRTADGTEASVLPPPWNVRSRVNEYGGQPWAGTARGGGAGPLVVFCHFPDQRLYAHEPDGTAPPRPLTPVSATGGGLRWADPVLHPDGTEVWCVLEEYTGEGPGDVRRVIAAVPLDGSAASDRTAIRELTDDRHRFVTGPRLSPDGTRAAWLAWDHPLMPWDGTLLMTGEVVPGGPFASVTPVAGAVDESVCQVDWAPDGSLLYASDRGGWWELYRRAPGATEATALCAGRGEEFGGPLWKVGWRWFRPLDSGLVAVVHGRGTTALGILDPETGELVDAAGPWTEWAPTLAAHGSRVFGVAAGPRGGYEVVELDTGTGRARVVGAAHRDPVDPAYYPEPRRRTFTGPGGREVHAHLYPPHHPGATAPDGELPPYVVWAHGGPTGRSPLVLDLEIAYFTSRGIGVAEVNYGGSTGYGRAYRDRLRGQWGVVDVEDCAAVARALAAEGTADPARLAIRGGSAGGWTAAASLAATDVYACAAVLYPVLDLTAWGTGGETHDFESHYLESLVGPHAEVPGLYEERSPLNRADRISAPFVLLQGLDDLICPPAQSERFLARMAGRGVPHAYLAFEGEEHGFRRAETLVRALEAELALYARAFGLDRADVPELEWRT